MAKLTFTVLVLTAITVQAEVRSDGGPRRIPRSPSPEDPPPPVFHTHQWSGFERSSDGKQAGVFSGAAAAADGGSHTSGQAFSVASAASGDNGPVLGTGSQVKVGQSGQPDKLESRFGGDDRLFDSSQGQFQSGYHGHSGGYNGGQFGGGQSGVKGGYHEGGGFRQSPYSYQQGAHDNFAKGGCCGGYGGGSFAQSQAQAHSSSGSGYGSGYRGLDDPGRITFGGQPSALGTGYGVSQNSNGGSGYYGVNQGFASNANSRANADSNTFGNSGSGQGYDRLQGFNGQNQNAGAATNAGASAGSNSIGQGYIPSQGYNGGQQSYNSGHEGYNSDHQGYNSERQGYNSEHQGYNSEHQGYNSGHEGYNSEHQGYNKGHSALKGALDLASQGLQSQSNPGCSTCGKSNYALSNAKSHSGDAVAVSVGG